MTLRSAAKTCLFVSAGVPATFDEAGYKALVWTEVLGTPTMPEFGPTKSAQTYDDMCSGQQIQYMGSTSNGGGDYSMADHYEDPGHLILKAAFEAGNGDPAQLVSVKIREKGTTRAKAGQAHIGRWYSHPSGIDGVMERMTNFTFTEKAVAEFLDA